jgi:hypothetical protein
LEVHHLDVESAFLYGELEEDIFMRLPDGCGEDSFKIAKLNKALYGLKQSNRAWNAKITKVLKKYGFVNLTSIDACLFVKVCADGTKLIIAIYVDDCVMVGKEKNIAEFKEFLRNEFKMKDLGKISGLLGMNFTRNDTSMFIDQGKYIEAVICRFGMKDCKISATPLEIKHNNIKNLNNNIFEDNNLYRQLVGCLNHITRCTRPDIAYAVNLLSQAVEAPTESNWIEAKRILRYLKGTMEYKLTYTKLNNENNLTGYVDASYAEDAKSRKSITGYTFLKSGAAITWKSKKQDIVTLSSTEAEYVALSTAAQESLWLIKLEERLEDTVDAITIYEDNQSAIKLSENIINSNRSKHIQTRYHFIREQVMSNIIKLNYIPTNSQVADIFTKSLPREPHTRHTKSLGLAQ